MPITIGKKRESDYTNPLGLLSDCHQRIEQFLDVLIKVVSQARGAALSADQQNGLETALRYFREAAPKHTRDEEESLFPRMLASKDQRVQSAISKLEQLNADHEIADAAHAEVDALGRQWLSQRVLSIESTERFRELLELLRSTYQRHIKTEDHEVFPLAGQILSSDELLSVGQEMAARRLTKLGAVELNSSGSSRSGDQ
jgi:hemerythrin-like domain-containing protein